MLWIVLPTRNESDIIARSLNTLRAFLDHEVREPWRIVVADNASTDTTRTVVVSIAAVDPRIQLFTLDRPGKGHAVLRAWEACASKPEASAQDIFLFMDVDLATDLRHLPLLIDAIRGGADIAVGSRLATGARVERSMLRRIVSRLNQALLRAVFGLPVADAPCGFKAVNERTVRAILPQVRDDQWFFDTELLIRAHRAGFQIVEIPVAWHEPRASSGSLRKVIRIAMRNLHAIRTLALDPSPGVIASPRSNPNNPTHTDGEIASRTRND